jgi:hypothetical protein
MSAIITTPFRVNNAAALITKVTSLLSTDKLFIAVGKSDPWPDSDATVAAPVDSYKDIAEFRKNIVAMKRVDGSNAGHVIPLVKFAQVPFKEWDPSDETNFTAGLVNGVQCLPAYCTVQSGSSYAVYKCVSSLKSSGGVPLAPSSPTAPSTTSYSSPQLVGGYLWAYMYTVSDSDGTFSRDFLPVPSGIQGTAYTALGNAGKIYGYRIKNAGAGYANGTFTVSPIGDGASAQATIVISGGVVTSASVSAGPLYGTGYTFARLVVPGTPSTVAVIEPLITPQFGHGYEPTIELGAYYASFGVSLAGAEDTDLPTSNDYRQMGLLLNPLNNSNAVITPSANGYASGQKSLTIPSFTGSLPADGILYQPSTGALAFLDSSTSTAVFFHQNYSTLVNFTAFAASSVVYVYPAGTTTIVGTTGTGSVGSFTPSAINTAEYKANSGTLLFVENRKRVSRDPSQTEEIKIIVQF